MALVWTFGSFDFIARGAVPASMRLGRGWRLNTTGVARRRGAYSNGAPYNDPIRLNLSGLVYGNSAGDLRDKEDALHEAINAGRAELKIHDDRYLLAIAEACAWEAARIPDLRGANFFLDLLADDGVWLSTALQSVAITTNGSDTATNSGNVASPPVITITAPGGGLTQAVITNTSSAKTLTWNGSLGASQDLIVDMDELTITEAGMETAAGFATGSVFWDLAAGGNTVTINSTPTGASAVVEWRHRWL